MKAEEIQARIAHEFVPLVKNAKDDALLLSVLADMLKKHASQLIPSIPKIEWRDDWEAWIGDYKIGYVEESERNMWFGSCVFSNTVYLGIYSTKQLAKQAVVDNWNNFISKVVVMEQKGVNI